ncbi:MAG: hypothetical protein Q7K43_05130, partial [Candidatus Woesearchaeota archaeon]|nr:hypothetical protein [Candidatus Woesearchaeota archaeon]
IRICKETITDKTIVGYHDAAEFKIAYEPLDSQTRVLTILHEMGHVISQALEQTQSPDAKAIDEGAAYSFVWAGLHELEKTEKYTALAIQSRLVFEQNMLTRAKNYVKNIDDQYHHNAGTALFLAIQADSDPYETFNIITSIPEAKIENLPELIKRRYETNKKALSLDPTAFERPIEELEKVSRKRDRLKKKCFKLGAIMHITDFIKIKENEGLSEEEIIDAIGQYKNQISYNWEIR